MPPVLVAPKRMRGRFAELVEILADVDAPVEILSDVDAPVAVFVFVLVLVFPHRPSARSKLPQSPALIVEVGSIEFEIAGAYCAHGLESIVTSDVWKY